MRNSRWLPVSNVGLTHNQIPERPPRHTLVLTVFVVSQRGFKMWMLQSDPCVYSLSTVSMILWLITYKSHLLIFDLFLNTMYCVPNAWRSRSSLSLTTNNLQNSEPARSNEFFVAFLVLLWFSTDRLRHSSSDCTRFGFVGSTIVGNKETNLDIWSALATVKNTIEAMAWNEQPQSSKTRIGIESLPDEVLVRIGLFVAKLCGIEDFVRFSMSSRRLKALLRDSERTTRKVVVLVLQEMIRKHQCPKTESSETSVGHEIRN